MNAKFTLPLATIAKARTDIEGLDEVTANVRSLGFDLDTLVEQKWIALDYVYIERSEIEETGDYDLEGLFIRLGHAIDSIGAKRVVLDTVEALFAAGDQILTVPALVRHLPKPVRVLM